MGGRRRSPQTPRCTSCSLRRHSSDCTRRVAACRPPQRLRLGRRIALRRAKKTVPAGRRAEGPCRLPRWVSSSRLVAARQRPAIQPAARLGKRRWAGNPRRTDAGRAAPMPRWPVRLRAQPARLAQLLLLGRLKLSLSCLLRLLPRLGEFDGSAQLALASVYAQQLSLLQPRRRHPMALQIRTTAVCRETNSDDSNVHAAPVARRARTGDCTHCIGDVRIAWRHGVAAFRLHGPLAHQKRYPQHSADIAAEIESVSRATSQKRFSLPGAARPKF